MNQSQRIEKINQCLNEYAAAGAAAGRAAQGLAKNPFLQQLLISLGIETVSSALSGEKKDKPLMRSASVSLQQPGSDVTSLKTRSPDLPPPRRFATLRGRPFHPGRM